MKNENELYFSFFSWCSVRRINVSKMMTHIAPYAYAGRAHSRTRCLPLLPPPNASLPARRTIRIRRTASWFGLCGGWWQAAVTWP